MSIVLADGSAPSWAHDLARQVSVELQRLNSGVLKGDRSALGAWTFANALRTTANVGIAATGTTAVEYGDGYVHTTVLTVDTTIPAIAGGADLAVGKLLYTFPAGGIAVESARMTLAITQSEGNITADTPDGGLGTTIGSGAVSVLSGTAAFENIVTGQTVADCDGAATDAIVADQPIGIAVSDAHTVHFNVADGWAAGGDAGAALTGTVILNWRYLGA